MYIYTYICVYMYMYMYVYMYVYVYVYMYMCVCVRVCVNVYVHVSVYGMQKHMHVSVSACMHSALNAVTLALIDAGLPMRDFVTACEAGYIDGHVLVDLNALEASGLGFRL